jgi:hypothetical protein
MVQPCSSVLSADRRPVEWMRHHCQDGADVIKPRPGDFARAAEYDPNDSSSVVPGRAIRLAIDKRPIPRSGVPQTFGLAVDEVG